MTLPASASSPEPDVSEATAEDSTARNARHSARPARSKNRVVIALSLLLVVLLAVWGADNVAAINVEKKLSTELRHDSNLPVDPGVTAGGFPFIYDLYRGELSSLSVTAPDILVPGFGLVSVHSTATKIKVSGEDLWAGKIENAPTESVSTTLQLDGLALGERLDMTDLTIRRLANIAPNGGRESDAVLAGTPPFIKEPATVAARLRIRQGNAFIEAYEVLEAPQDDTVGSTIVPGSQLDPAMTKKILDAFSLQLQGQYLPLRRNPDYIYSEGGSIFLENHLHNVNISLYELAPIAQNEAESLQQLRDHTREKRNELRRRHSQQES